MSQPSEPGPWDFLRSAPADAAPAILTPTALEDRTPAEPVPTATATAEPAAAISTAPSPAPARPAAKPGRFRLVLGPEPETAEELVTPEKVKSWSSSVAFHILLLLTLAFTVLSQPRRDAPTLETSLPAGDPAGSDLGNQLTGGLGIDEPLAMPYAPLESQAEPVAALTAPDAATLTPELTAPIRPRDDSEASARGGGVTLDGSGQAGRGDGFGVAKFGLGGKEMVNDVEIKVGNPQFTLIWNTTADIDLHVLEPGGSHIYWERRRGAGGGELDVDDVDGLGPENIYWGGGLNKGNGPPGEYKWYVHYYGGREGNLPTRWKVRLKYNGDYKVFEGRLNSIGQRSKIYSFKLEGDGTESDPSPRDEPPRDARDSEMRDFDRPAGSFDDPVSANTRGQRAFGGGVTQELDEAPSPTPPERPRPPATTSMPPAAPPNEPRRPSGPPRDASGWVIIEPPDARFRAVFPAEPFEELRTLEDRPGEPQLHTWKLDRGEGGLAISYLDIPPGRRGASVETILDDEAHAVAAELGGGPAEISPITIGRVTARELRCSVPDRLVAGGGQLRARLVVRDGRLFRVEALGTPAFLALPEVDRFLRGFSLAD